MALKQTALITGASSGIGLALAQGLARRGYNLVLVARNLDALNQIKRELLSRYPIQVMLQQHDLTEQGSPAAIFDVLSKAGVQVDVLINNAGFGDCGAFVNANLNRQLDMLRLNNFALTALCHYFAQAMVQRKQGRIVNIASVAAFLPGPQMAVYYATKAYVLNFSLALNYELRKDGVTVTTVCPGPTATNFAVTANIQNAKLFKGKKLPTAASVADATIQGFERGRALVIPGFSNWLLATLVPIMPRSMTLAVVNKLNQT